MIDQPPDDTDDKVDPHDSTLAELAATAAAELAAADAEEVTNFCAAPSAVGLPIDLVEEPQEKALEKAPNSESTDNSDVRALIAAAGLPGKIKLALFGNSVCRGLLIRDANRMVQQFVLKNPKIAMTEIEDFAKNPNIAEGVLRIIADSKMFMKSSTVRANLVSNPKTPQAIALKWLRYLQQHDLKRISKSRNLPQVVALAAKKILAETERK